MGLVSIYVVFLGYENLTLSDSYGGEFLHRDSSHYSDRSTWYVCLLQTSRFLFDHICNCILIELLTFIFSWINAQNQNSDVIMSAMASSNHRRLNCFLNHLFRRRSKKTLKLCVTGLCEGEGNQPGTGGFPHKGPETWNKFPFPSCMIYDIRL